MRESGRFGSKPIQRLKRDFPAGGAAFRQASAAQWNSIDRVVQSHVASSVEYDAARGATEFLENTRNAAVATYDPKQSPAPFRNRPRPPRYGTHSATLDGQDQTHAAVSDAAGGTHESH